MAVDELTGKVVGYVLGKMEDDDATNADMVKGKMSHGHITSISVLRDYRKLGIATKLMRACHTAMKDVYKAKYVSLHVRKSNRAALTLYKDVLKYEICNVADEYYADKEDAYDMKLFFDTKARAYALKKPVEDEEEKKEESTADSSAKTIETQTDGGAAATSSAAQGEAGEEPAAKKKKKKNKKKKKGGAAAADAGDGGDKE